MGKTKICLILIAVFILAAAGAVFYYYNLRGVWPAILPAPQKIKKGVDATGLGLKIADGFSISVLADNLPGARVMALDGRGNMWVSQTGEGKIAILENENRKVKGSEFFKNLNRPHGLAFDPQDGLFLYFAEEDKISKVRLYAEDKPHKIADLPGGGRHFSRTLGFGPDGRLYVSIGSSCDVCYETDKRRAAIYSMKKDGSDFKEFAKGLRNAVFFTWSYIDGKMWATEMGRDLLGDNLPPDEINVIEEGKNYGWPVCYGKNIHDTDFDPVRNSPPQSPSGAPSAGAVSNGVDKNVYVRDPCADKTPSYIDLQAHSAPLGLAFVPEEGWPQDYWYNLFVAYHGSWNRSEPTGYKIVRIKLDDKGNYLGTEDFITGWLKDATALGRPVDILVQPGGLMYISDDKAGVIYKITYNGDGA